MIKAVNIKNYKFKNGSAYFSRGYAMIDTETNEFVSFDGVLPYVLDRKNIIQSCIDGGWWQQMKRCKAS